MRSCAAGLGCPRCGASYELAEAPARCASCASTLEVAYDYDAARRSIEEHPLASRRADVWRLRELLPCQGPFVVGHDAGFTPLLHARRLGRELGLDRLYLKDDTVSRPSLSYKDRNVSVAVQHAVEAGATHLGCVSTGNVGNAVAIFAARAGLRAHVVYPRTVERAKMLVSRLSGAHAIQVDGTYDEVNALCREVGPRIELPFANISMRPFYAEGAKTLTYEVVEQLGGVAPDHILLPVAGATLINKVGKAFDELVHVGVLREARARIHVAQAAGCAPVASAIAAGERHIRACVPNTYAHSIAIGAPGDGDQAIALVHRSGGTAGTATDDEIRDAIALLARTEGVLAEPAGGVSIAVAAKLAAEGRLARDEVTVAAVTGNGLKTIAELAGDAPRSGDEREPLVPCTAEALERELARAM